VILLAFLRLRGWTWIRLGLRPRWLDPLLGVLAAIVLYGMINVVWLLAMSVSSNAVEAATDQSFIASDYWPRHRAGRCRWSIPCSRRCSWSATS